MRENDAIFSIRRGVAYPRLSNLNTACGDQKLPFREVSITDDIATSLSIDPSGVSVEELLDFEINGLLDHISGCLADVGIKLAGILKRLLEADGGGWVRIDWMFRKTVVFIEAFPIMEVDSLYKQGL